MDHIVHDEIDPFDDPEERRVLYAALDSFRQYRRAAHYNITHLRRESFYALPSAHSEILSAAPFNLSKTFREVDIAIDKNADIAEVILALGLETYGVDPASTDWHGAASPNDMDKARSTIRQMYRDWTEEGAGERRACFEPMISSLNEFFSTIPLSKRHMISVLVPGAGLGRLVLDVCAAGYIVEGNEISYHQLLASNWLLNNQPQPKQHEMYPWALSFSNHRTRANQLQKVLLPDVAPAQHMQETSELIGAEVHAFQRMSMSSGDFCVLYKQSEYRETFNAVLTCFFIDTAPNLLAYIDTVKSCLQVGGVWINLGPLLWHFEGRARPDKSELSTTDRGIGEAGSFELADDEVMALLQQQGFTVKHHDVDAVQSGYIQDPNSMLQNIYRPSFWAAEKNG